MKIVNIEDFFHPDAGYQINILPKYLGKFGHEVIIVTSEMDKVPDALTLFFGRENIEQRDNEYQEKNNVKIIRLPLKAFISGRAIFTDALKKTIKELSPDVLYVHGNDTAVGMWALKNQNKFEFPLIMDSHMLEMASTNPFNKTFHTLYRKIFTPIIKKNDITVIRTQDDPYVEKVLGIPLTQAPWISYGSDTLLFYPNAEIKKSFRVEHSISKDDFVVVYTGKLDEAKGGKLLAQAFRNKFETDRNVVLVVVGSTGGEYGREVEQTFSESENRVIRFPTQRYCDLAQFYQAADLSVFAKQCSLSFYDAQACGLPVLSEDNNINVDRCSHGNGWNFKAGDKEDFRKKILDIINMDAEAFRTVSKNAYQFIIDNYNYEDKAREYERIIANEFNKGRK